MHRLSGHALMVLAGGVGAALCLAWLSPAEGPASAQVMAAAVAADPPALRPLPASAAQQRYARAEATQAQRQALAAAVQRELHRVGCYAGPVDGHWGAGSRQALSAFGRAVKLRLLADVPDEAVLRLVEAQPRRVCGEDQAPREEARLPHRPTFAEPRLISEPVAARRPSARIGQADVEIGAGPRGPTQDVPVQPVPPRAMDKARSDDREPPPPAFVRNLARSMSSVLAPLGW